jgi:5-methylcytosine-specific restriction enzyme A
MTTCELCHRDVERYTVHHLIPRSRGGKFGPTARLCPTCHRQLHALVSETTLAQELYSVELLRTNPQVNAYLRWVRKHSGTANFRVRRANVRH